MSSATIAPRSAYRLNMSPEAAEIGRFRATAVRVARSAEYVRRVGPIAQEHRQIGMPLREVADQLSEDGYRTPRGLKFTTSQVAWLLDRYERCEG